MPPSATRVKDQPKTPQPAANAPEKRKETSRDLIEQVVVALILAFLIRGFEAEAFVIPTGSMAPTLMGRHKDVTCPECGQNFQVNASEEIGRVGGGTCINCRYPARLDEETNFKGDRILVMKFLYSLPFLPGAGGPQRWDVVVFKNPQEPEVNYIKRLVGLPNEELRVTGGDVLVRPLEGDKPFRYPRRPLAHQQAMQMLVWNDAHRPRHLAGRPEWTRWAPATAGAWSEDADSPGRFTTGAQGAEWAELRYRHLVPDPAQWHAILEGGEPETPPRPSLVTDFYSYNSHTSAWGSPGDADSSLRDWVGDLTLECRVQAKEARGRLRLEVVRGGVAYRCVIDLSNGLASFYRGNERISRPVPTHMKDTARHHIAFANVDERLTLWIDGQTPFMDGREYGDGSGPRPKPTAADLEPAAIATNGASVVVDGLVLKRDIYYTQGTRDSAEGTRSFEALTDPARFAELAPPEARDFRVRPGHYLMMGDNSPRSHDSRLWGDKDQLGDAEFDPTGDSRWDPIFRQPWEVPEALLVGKAFFVYWPHGVPFWPNIQLWPDFRVPFRPYFERMKWIR